MATETELIMDELKNIKDELHYIKAHMIDVDTILTAEEKKLIDESIVNEKAGKLISLEELKNVRSNA